MSDKPSLIGASLQASLTTIDIINESYGNQIGLLPESDTKTLKKIISGINKSISDLSLKISEYDKIDKNKESFNFTLNRSSNSQSNSQAESAQHNVILLDSRRHTISSDCCRNIDERIPNNDLSISSNESGTTSNIKSNETTALGPHSTTLNTQNQLMISNSTNKRRLSLPFIQQNQNNYQNQSTIPIRQRNISILPGPPRFRKKSKQISIIHPMLHQTKVSPDGGATRRTLSQPVRPIIDATRQNSSDESWNNVAKDAFNLIDVNSDGYLQREEVIAAIEKIKESGSMNANVDAAEMADSMMKEVDVDGDGQIDIDEFLDMMRRSAPGQANGNMMSHNNRMSQLARNVLLAHQKKIENSVIGNDMWMVHPLSHTHAIWDILVSIIILLTVVTMPFALGWEELDKALYPMTLTIDILFGVDVIKNFNTGFIDDNDAIIMDASIVRWRYFTGFFATDFFSCLPYNLFLNAAGSSSSNDAVSGTAKNSLKMLRLIRMTKLFRLLRISRLFIQIKKVSLKVEEILHFRISDGFTKLLRLGLGALVLGHWIGSLNFMLVRLNDFPEDSWVVYANLQDKGPYTQWSWSFFKALAQMIMIGFETPPFTNASCDTISRWCSIEHWITLLCLYIGAVFYSLLISSISSILLRANLASRQFEEKLIQIDDYMRSKKLPATLREKVKDHFHMQHSDGKLFNEEEIFNSVPPVLRREIKHFNGRDVAMKVPLLSSVTNKSFCEEMTSVIELAVAFTDELIIRENTTGEDMYFINSGVVEIFLSGAKNNAYVAIGDGCFFGEVSLLLGIRRIASVKTKTQCSLYKITKQGLLKILDDYPEIKESLIKVAKSRKNRLAHYIDPLTNPLNPGDEVDSEDRKTELFGVDADEITHEKREAFENSRRHAKVGRGITYRETIKRPHASKF